MVMISREAIEEYLDFEGDDWDFIKGYSYRDLMSELADMKYMPLFLTRPYLHQLQVTFLLMFLNRMMLILDMGVGKTKIMLDTFSHYRRIGMYRDKEKLRMLVVTHNDPAVRSWTNECEVHSNLRSIEVVGSRDEKQELLAWDSDVYITTYSAISSFVSHLQKPDDKKKGKKARGKRKIDRSVARSVGQMFDFLVLDEVHKVRNIHSLMHRVCFLISRECEWVYGLTGTPSGRDPVAFFGEMLCIDLGETFGTGITLFKSSYYDEVRRGRWMEPRFREDLMDDFRQRLKHRTITYTNEECFDVPNIVRHSYVVKATKEMRKVLSSLLQAVKDRARNDDYSEMSESYFHAMRRATGGNFIAEDEEGELLVPIKGGNPKADAVIGLIENMPEKSKAVVFYEYNGTGDLMQERLSRENISHEVLRGSTKDKRGVVDRFTKNKNVKLLLTNWKTGGTALNLQCANYVIYMESPTSPIERSQSEMRIRPRMHERSFIYDVVVEKSTDERVLELLKEGKDFLDLVLKGKIPVWDGIDR